MRTCVSAVLLLLVCVKEQTVDGCPCFYLHVQEIFCNAQTVFQAKVLGEEPLSTDPENIVYRINVTKVLWGADVMNITHVATSKIFSSGIKLGRGLYLLSGTVENERIDIIHCDLHKKWVDIKSKRALRVFPSICGYKCKITKCYREYCPVPGKDECILDYSKSFDMFHPDGAKAFTSFCMPNSTNVCEWSFNPKKKSQKPKGPV